MKLFSKNIDDKGKGTVTLGIEDEEDIWQAYNLINRGDSVKSSTYRKVITESSTGTTGSNKIRITLTLRVENTEYDGQSAQIRVKGKNIVENDYVKMGQYHTIDIEINTKFTLWKFCWDSISAERLELACDPAKKADLIGLVMQPGLAYLCLITDSMTVVKSKIEVNIPKKRNNAVSQHEKGMDRFMDAIMQALLRHVDFEIVKCVIIASPGFTKDQFYKYMCDRMVKENIKVLIDNKHKFLLVHSNSGFKSALTEVLADPMVLAKLEDTKAITEVQTLEKFFEMLELDQDRAYYSWSHVSRAHYEYQAIEKLLISDKLFRSTRIADRKKYIKLVDDVKANGGEVYLFSSMHVSGQQLDNMSGIAAILRYPIPEIDEMDQAVNEARDLDNEEDERLEDEEEPNADDLKLDDDDNFI